MLMGTWVQNLVCDLCGEELSKPCALLFSPPDNNGRPYKHHICEECYEDGRWMPSDVDEEIDVPLTPREGDTVRIKSGITSAEVVCVLRWYAVLDDGENAPFIWAISDLTVTHRPPKRPVRVWLTDEQVRNVTKWMTGGPVTKALIDACRAMVDNDKPKG
jgi:hypothetical protein